MVSYKRVTEITVAAVLFASLGGAVYAQGAAAQIQARIAFMKTMGADLAIVRSKAATDMPAAKAAAVKIQAGLKAFPGQFPKGSDATAGKTRAKAEIWTDAAGWKAANDKALAAANNLVKATSGTDAAAVTTALTAVQQGCASCHTPYRGPAAA